MIATNLAHSAARQTREAQVCSWLSGTEFINRFAVHA